jgi:hypothetical protein
MTIVESDKDAYAGAVDDKDLLELAANVGEDLKALKC